MVKLIIAGACGRMSRRIIALAEKDKQVKITGAFENKDHADVGRTLTETHGVRLSVKIDNSLAKVINRGDIIIDFTSPAATLTNLELAISKKKGMVIGTTGLKKAQLQKIHAAGKTIPVVQAPNMSLGVNLLFRLAELTTSKLPLDYDIEIVETHHRHKKDAPSGTALELGRRIAQARKKNLEQVALYGRHGMVGERREETIGIHAVRGGDVVGEHVISYFTGGERIELVHRASSRDAFAKGAVLAAKFLEGKKRGFFTMQDVLGL